MIFFGGFLHLFLFAVFLNQDIGLGIAEILCLEEIAYALHLVVVKTLGKTEEEIAVTGVGEETYALRGCLDGLVE